MKSKIGILHNFLLCHSLDLVVLTLLVSISLLLLDVLCIDLVLVELLPVLEVLPAGYSIPIDVKGTFVASWAKPAEVYTTRR